MNEFAQKNKDKINIIVNKDFDSAAENAVEAAAK